MQWACEMCTRIILRVKNKQSDFGREVNYFTWHPLRAGRVADKVLLPMELLVILLQELGGTCASGKRLSSCVCGVAFRSYLVYGEVVCVEQCQKLCQSLILLRHLVPCLLHGLCPVIEYFSEAVFSGCDDVMVVSIDGSRSLKRI